MQFTEKLGVSDPNLLRILIEINRWEEIQRRELQTVSGRELYFSIAASLLDESQRKRQSLKQLNGRITQRAMRDRIGEFQKLGLVDVVNSEIDSRTKRVQPTDKFIKRLNRYLYFFKHLLDEHFLIVKKN